MTMPILYSFRRCPYAMRARLAIASAGIAVELREIVLRNKPEHMITASPKATVPVLILKGQVIDESYDIMLWSLQQNDPENWLKHHDTALISTITGPFKEALDRYKYATRYENVNRPEQQQIAAGLLSEVDRQLAGSKWLAGNAPGMTDMATLPFIRQFAHVDKTWFDAQPWPNVAAWLARFLSSQTFNNIMYKYPTWQQGDAAETFPRPHD